jgi:hypothetical protein
MTLFFTGFVCASAGACLGVTIAALCFMAAEEKRTSGSRRPF